MWMTTWQGLSVGPYDWDAAADAARDGSAGGGGRDRPTRAPVSRVLGDVEDVSLDAQRAGGCWRRLRVDVDSQKW